MEIELLSGACGAEIAGIDLRDTSDGNINTIKDDVNKLNDTIFPPEEEKKK